jgi:hypothetical protein
MQHTLDERMAHTACNCVRCEPVRERNTRSHTFTCNPHTHRCIVGKAPPRVSSGYLWAFCSCVRVRIVAAGWWHPLRADGTHFVLMMSDHARGACTLNRPYYNGPIIEGFADLKCMAYVHTKLSYANLSDQIIKGFADLKCMVYVRTNSPYTNLIRPDYK